MVFFLCTVEEGQLGTAVSQLEPPGWQPGGARGTVRFVQVSKTQCLVEALVFGFPPGMLSIYLV